MKRISIRILDVQDSKHEGELFAMKERSVDSNGGEEAEFEDEDELNLNTQKPRIAKSKTRPGTLGRSIASTKSIYGGAGQTSAEENQCLRRKEFGHWWRDCPKPFDKNLIFPKVKVAPKGTSAKGGKGTSAGKPGKKGKGKTFIAGEEEELSGEAEQDNVNTGNVADSGKEEDDQRYELQTAADNDYWYDEEPWIADFARVEDIANACNIWWCDSALPAGQTLATIDSGASACVCGIEWYREWKTKNDVETIRESDKVF